MEAFALFGKRNERSRFKLVILLLFLVSCKPLVPPSPTGEIASSNKYGTVALLRGNHQFCSGVAITPHHILTAAHCVTLRTAYGGMSRKLKDKDSLRIGVRAYVGDTYPRRKVLNISLHPKWPDLSPTKWDILGKWHDIALLRVDVPLPLWVPILPWWVVGRIPIGYKVTISGYAHGALFEGRTSFRGRNHYEVWVGRKGEPYHGMGSSGGPVYIRLRGRIFLLSIASRTATSWGSISTLVYPHLKWIKANL